MLNPKEPDSHKIEVLRANALGNFNITWHLNCPLCARNCIDSSCKHQVSFVADVMAQQTITSAFDLLVMRSMRYEPAFQLAS